MRKLENDPSLVEGAAEELLRYDPAPVQRAGRRAAEDIELRGRHIREGQRVFFVIGWP